jgi:hypothetical protein
VIQSERPVSLVLIAEARERARGWVRQNAAREPGFAGAFFTGSSGELQADAALPPTSDVDIVVVLDVRTAPPKLGTIVIDGLVLEVTYAALAEFDDTAAVARNYHLANSFRRDQLIADPTGRLAELRDAIAPFFHDPEAILARCDNALDRIRSGLAEIDATAAWQQQVMGWMFSTSITTHVVLVAALRNPTVRLRYAAARAVLVGLGRLDMYDELLDQLGVRDLQAATIARQLDELEPLFDDAVGAASTPFFFSSDISDGARHIVFEGSHALIADGLHREAVFWIIATYTRCMTILAADAPRLAAAHEPTFRNAVTQLLGVQSTGDLLARAERTLASLPALRAFVAEQAAVQNDA